jgi:hypothetical protein
MITAIIFAAHIIFAMVIFTKKWQDENLKSGFINLSLIGVLFAVGWSISGIIAKLIMKPEGFGLYYDRDTFSLSILSIAEYFFYKFYYKEETISVDMEKQ